MKKFNLILSTTLLVAIVALTQCSTTEKNLTIAPPLNGVDVAFNDFTIDPNTGGEFTLETGTKITVPANAFIDKNGDPITDRVQLKYREFHNSADIIASGIPMQFKSENGTENFESAGMFEIDGYVNGEEVFIKEGKNLTVDMGSFKDGEGYAMYYFDEGTDEWKDIGPTNVRENKAKTEKVKALPAKPVKPIMPKKAAKDAPVLNLQVNYDRYPEFKAFNGVMWQYAGTDPEKDPTKQEWLKGSTWSNVELTCDDPTSGVYNLSLTVKDKSFKTEVVPVMSGRNFEAAKAKFQQKAKAFEKAVDNRKKEMERVNREADLLRTFQVNNFGIYNCDRFYNDPNVVALNADFNFSEEVNTSKMTIYLIPDNESAVIQYRGENSWKGLKINPNKPNTVMAVLPGNKIAYCKPQGIKKVQDGEGLIDYTFKMKTHDKVISDMSALSEVIAEL